MLTFQMFPDEYPLFNEEARKKCPSARFVGGVSLHLCECQKPLECKGVQRMIELFIDEQAKRDAKKPMAGEKC